VQWVCTARKSGEKTTAARLHARLQAHQLREGLNEDAMFYFVFN